MIDIEQAPLFPTQSDSTAMRAEAQRRNDALLATAESINLLYGREAAKPIISRRF
jgi:hypothetical protein